MSEKVKDIYIKLLEDITGVNIDPDTTILQSQEEYDNATKEARIIDDALKNSCKEFVRNLGVKEIFVGSAPETEKGYIEPCPLQYTGDISNGKKFHCVFFGLNPHLDKHLWRPFYSGATFADLANFHHSDDIHYNHNNNYPPLRYSPNGEIKNNYWRVMGNMKYFEPRNIGSWSPFYKHAIRIHLALLPNGFAEVHDKFTENLKNKTNYLLAKLREFPIANFELVPYKSKGFSVSRFYSILDDKNKTDFAIKYRKYFKDMIEFMDRNTDENAYIIATGTLDEENKVTMFDAVYKIFKEIIAGAQADEEKDFYVYSKTNRCFMTGTRDSSEFAHTYIFKWGNRKVIIAPAISNRSPYNWIYQDFTNGWVDAIKHWPII